MVLGSWMEGDAPSEMRNPGGENVCREEKLSSLLDGPLESDVPVGRTSGSSPMGRQLLGCLGKRSRHTEKLATDSALGKEDKIHYFLCLTLNFGCPGLIPL